MKRMLPLFLILAMVSCQEEEEVATVTFWAQCGSCRIQYGLDGTMLGTDSVGGSPVVQQSFPAKVGQEASLSAQALAVSNTGMGITIQVNGVQQDFALLHPNAEALLDSVISLRITVPKLDRYGEPE